MATTSNPFSYISYQLVIGLTQRLQSNTSPLSWTNLVSVLLGGTSKNATGDIQILPGQQSIVTGMFSVIERGNLDLYLQGGTREDIILKLLIQDISIRYMLPTNWSKNIVDKSANDILSFLKDPRNQVYMDDFSIIVQVLQEPMTMYSSTYPNLSKFILGFTSSSPNAISNDLTPFKFLSTVTPLDQSPQSESPEVQQGCVERNNSSLYWLLGILLILAALIVYLTIKKKRF